MRTRALAAAFAATLLLTACSSGSDEPAAAPTTSTAPQEIPINLGDDTIEVLGVFTISDGDTIDGADDDQQLVFDRFAEVIPAEYRPEVTHFVSISQEDSDGTDGAMQHPVDENEDQIYDDYYIALDTTGSAAGATLDRTMVHEFAHLLTLRNGQITPLSPEAEQSDEPVECVVYATPECPTDDSYLSAYFSEFEYADDAEYDPEVFAEWVLNDGDVRTVTDEDVRRDVVAGSVLDEKFDFFESYPELVEVRDAIRAGLAA